MKYRVKVHIDIVHKYAIPFPCPQCPYRANQKVSITNHVKSIHEEIRDRQCPMCEFSATYKAHRENHLERVHEREKRYFKPYCDYRDAKKLQIGFHIKIQHQNMPLCQLKDRESRQNDLNMSPKKLFPKEMKYGFTVSQETIFQQQESLVFNNIITWITNTNGKIRFIQGYPSDKISTNSPLIKPKCSPLFYGVWRNQRIKYSEFIVIILCLFIFTLYTSAGSI